MRILVAALLCLSATAAAEPASIVADCAANGVAVRVVTGGAVPGMQAYVHEVSKGKATFLGAVDVKYGIKPHNNTVEMNLVGEGTAAFQLVIAKAEAAGGARKATLIKGEVGGKKLDGQEFACTLAQK